MNGDILIIILTLTKINTMYTQKQIAQKLVNYFSFKYRLGILSESEANRIPDLLEIIYGW